MREEKAQLRGLLQMLKNEQNFALQLLLITRHFKEGMRYTKKVDKYKYKASLVNINEEIKEYFYNLFIEKLEYKLSDKDLMIEDYDIISDDLDNTIYTYELNPDLDFSDVIFNQLEEGTDIPNVTSLDEVEDNLWAYCVKINFIHEQKEILYFRKMNSGKIVTSKKNMVQKLKCNFSTNEPHLEVLHDDVINFDDKIDCFYMNDKFYVLRKKLFESILGLENEFKANAKEVLEDLKNNDVIDGLDIFAEKVQSSKRLLRKMANIAKSKNHKNIDSQRIDNMKGIVRRLDLDLNFSEEDKIIVEDNKDAKVVVKMLDKYYLECMQTQEPYGSFAKKSLLEQT